MNQKLSVKKIPLINQLVKKLLIQSIVGPALIEPQQNHTVFSRFLPS